MILPHDLFVRKSPKTALRERINKSMNGFSTAEKFPGLAMAQVMRVWLPAVGHFHECWNYRPRNMSYLDSSAPVLRADQISSSGQRFLPRNAPPVVSPFT